MTKMKAAVFVEPGRIVLDEKPVPDVGPLDALMRVTTTTICGTDVHILKGEYPVARGLTIGHEPVGVIEKLGSAVKGYREGQRVIAGAITPSGWSHACLCGVHSQDGAAVGLTPAQVAAAWQRHGRNELPAPPRRSPLLRFLLQFHPADLRIAMLPIPTAPERACTLHRPDGSVIAYRVVPAVTGARGLALVLLHGLASNLSRWSEFVEHCALRGRHALIRLDLRGHGGSATQGAIGLEVWADDIAAVLNAQGHERAILVGHSLGAQLALHFAGRHPQRAAGLVLIDPVFREALRGRWRLLAAGAPLLRGAARALRALNTLGLRRRHLEPLDLRELDILARQALTSPAAEAAFVRRYSSARADLRHTRTATYLQDLAEMFRPPPDPATLRLPVLALLSGGATFADAAVMRDILARLPDVTLAAIACQHWPLTERPAEVRAAIERWCEDAGADGGEDGCARAAADRAGQPAPCVEAR